MNQETELIEKIEIFYSVEGHEKPFSEGIEQQATVSAFALLASKAAGLEGPVEVSLEDADTPLSDDSVLVEQLGGFALVHVSRPGAILTTIHYNGRQAHCDFRPNVTIGRVTDWAIGPHGLKLEGEASDYQIKHNGHVVPPERHLGQITRGSKTVELELVWKMKPQGHG